MAGWPKVLSLAGRLTLIKLVATITPIRTQCHPLRFQKWCVLKLMQPVDLSFRVRIQMGSACHLKASHHCASLKKVFCVLEECKISTEPLSQN